MKQRILAVMPESTNYISGITVTVARSFEAAKRQIELAEAAAMPFDALDLPAGNQERFWAFLTWMQKTGRNYPFSVFGCKNDKQFWALCEQCRSNGFIFRT